MNKQEHFKNKEYICYDGFSNIEINSEGDILPCCPDWHNHYKFGNIYQQSFESIINSNKAKDFRKSLLDGSYKYCNPDICMATSIRKDKYFEKCNEDGVSNGIIDIVRFAHDKTCNIKCITCRNDYINTADKTEKLNSLIDSHFIPMLKGAKIVHLNTNGEVFASSHCKKLIYKIIENYPNIKFDITSNGILFNEENCKKLNIEQRINNVGISIPAATNRTYNKITGSTGSKNYSQLYKNLKYLIDLKKRKIINELSIIFVVNYYNYKEMIKFARKPIIYRNKIRIYFWEYRPWSSSDLSKEYDKMAVWKEDNENYKDFCKIINNKIFNAENIFLPEIFLRLKKEDRENKILNKLISKIIKKRIFR